MTVKINQYVVMLIILVLVLGLFAFGLEVKKLKSEVAYLSGAPSRTAGFKHPRTRHEFFGLNGGRDPFEDETSPLDDLALLQRHMDQIFTNNFGRDIWHKGIVPDNIEKLYSDSDVKEYKDKYIINMDIPGMEKENINIEVKNGTLFVSGERNSEQEENKPDFHRKERNFGYFSQDFTLPEDANSAGIAVTYNKGVLNIAIPKIAKAGANNDKATKITVN